MKTKIWQKLTVKIIHCGYLTYVSSMSLLLMLIFLTYRNVFTKIFVVDENGEPLKTKN